MANTPDADILAEALEILRERIANRAVTILAKVQAHRGEPLNMSKQILWLSQEGEKEKRKLDGLKGPTCLG